MATETVTINKVEWNDVQCSVLRALELTEFLLCLDITRSRSGFATTEAVTTILNRQVELLSMALEDIGAGKREASNA